MTSFIAHLHPVLVHLPIGILMLAFLLECMARWFQQEQVRPAIRLALAFGLMVAILSASTGWLLADEGGYDNTILQRHRWFGIATTLLFLATWYLQKTRWYFPVFTIGVAGLIATGHFGGSLTHGENFLLKGLSPSVEMTEAATAEVNPETPIFKEIISPILQSKCVSCHRPEKQKGGLVLSTEEGILSGGKNGRILVPGNIDSSKMLQRIHLPLHHDDHMPPSGKSQLSPLEIQLLEWWIASGADFQALLKDKPLPPELVETMQKTNMAPANPVFSLKVQDASNRDIERLKSLHIMVQLLGQGTPWLVVSMAGHNKLTQQHWEALEAISEQLVDLDLSHTSILDQDLSSRNFPHLVRVNLAHTPLDNGSLKFLQRLTYAETINLTNTLVDNELQSILAKLPHLKKLFLWQTKTTEQAITSWKRQFPNLQIETGAVVPDDQPLILRSPKLAYGRSFFDDTMHLALNFPFQGVDIYYTLEEAASPTTQSPKYRNEIILDKTAHVRAFAAKEGWQNSPLAEAVFVRKKFTIAGATLAKLPSPKYPAKGATSLIDGRIADAQGADTWLGFEGESMDATLDLGETREIGHVFVHCLENNSPWIFCPAAIQVSTSLDGKSYQQQAVERFPPNTSMGEQKVHLLGCHFPKTTPARYVRVQVISPLKNPAWHPGKGQKCWIFVDELTIE